MAHDPLRLNGKFYERQYFDVTSQNGGQVTHSPHYDEVIRQDGKKTKSWLLPASDVLSFMIK